MQKLINELIEEVQKALSETRERLKGLSWSEKDQHLAARDMGRIYAYGHVLRILKDKANTLKPGHRTAKKPYDCKAYEFIQNAEFWPGELTFSELRAIAKAKQAKGKILPGETYLQKRVSVWDEPIIFRAKPELHDICLRFELYQI